MSSKSDFLSWDDSDINLDLLLGEYTASDIDSDENAPPSKKVKKSAKSEYQCPECDNSYSSASGFRGHLRNKHSLNNVKLNDHRSTKEGTVKPKETSYSMTNSEFSQIFDTSFNKSLDQIINCPFRNSSRSAKGQMIIEIAKIVKNNCTPLLVSILRMPFFKAILSTESSRNNDMSANEQLFNSYFELTSDNDIHSKITKILLDQTDQSLHVSIKPFIAVLEDELLKQILTERATLFSKKADEPSPISETDQSIIFYIAGYIISAIKKESTRNKKSTKHKELNSIIGELVKSNSNCNKTFVKKYSNWTSKLDRGGLQTPCDNFFLLIREFEQTYRKLVDLTSLTAMSLDKSVLINSMSKNFMINYYWDQLCTDSELKEYALEKCLRLFLTVRGFSTARQIKLKLLEKKETSTKPLRQALKEKSNRLN